MMQTGAVTVAARQPQNETGNAGLLANASLENGRYCIWYSITSDRYA
jgi:hypothetical protein